MGAGRFDFGVARFDFGRVPSDNRRVQKALLENKRVSDDDHIKRVEVSIAQENRTEQQHACTPQLVPDIVLVVGEGAGCL